MSRAAKLRTLLEKDPTDVFLNFGLAMELLKEDQKEEALAQFDHVVDLDPDYVAGYVQKGQTLIALGRRDEARRTLAAGVAAAHRTGDSHSAEDAQRMLDSLP
ncbi:MAG: tetratricopeptide repeat protein [Phycisphaerae bacterium]